MIVYAYEVPGSQTFPGSTAGLTRLGHKFAEIDQVVVARDSAGRFIKISCTEELDRSKLDTAVTSVIRSAVPCESDLAVIAHQKYLDRAEPNCRALLFFDRSTFI